MRTLVQMTVAMVVCVSCVSSVRAQVDGPAAQAFEELVRVHRTWDRVRVESTLTIRLQQDGIESPGESTEAMFLYSEGGRGLIRINGYNAFIGNGELSVTHASNVDEYFTVPVQGYAYNSVVWDGFGSFQRIPFPHLGIFWGADDMDDLYMELYADTPELTPTALTDRVIDGRNVRTIEFAGPEGSLQINYDLQSWKIDSIRQEITGGWQVPEGTVRVNEFEFTYSVGAGAFADEEVTFDGGDRQRVNSMQFLAKDDARPGADPGGGRGLLGGRAPSFVLQTPDGTVVDLDELRGFVVVVDFWAVWCPPCREALPHLHSVAAWAEQEDLPVKIFAINSWENGETKEEKAKAAMNFWNRAGHSLPVPMDYEGAVSAAYGVTGIPATFVISPEGVVVAEHSGFSPDYAESLKAEILSALDGHVDDC